MTGTSQKAERVTLPYLSGLRGVAIVLVMAMNSSWVVGRDVLSGGFLGIDIFFVVSGFLITALLASEYRSERSVDYVGYFQRRALRILPPLALLIAGHFIYAWIAGLSMDTETSTAIAVGGFFTNYWQAAGRDVAEGMSHLWAVAVEQHFLLLWPVVYVLMRRTFIRRRSTELLILAIVAAVIAWRFYLFDASAIGVPEGYFRTDTRIDSLLIGSLLGMHYRRIRLPDILAKFALLVGAAGVVVGIVLLDPASEWAHKGGFTAVAAATGLVLIGLLQTPSIGRSVLSWRPLVALGELSFGLYLFHLPVFVAVQRHVGDSVPSVLRLALALAVTAGITALSWRLLELPILRLKSRTRTSGQHATAHIAV